MAKIRFLPVLAAAATAVVVISAVVFAKGGDVPRDIPKVLECGLFHSFEAPPGAQKVATFKLGSNSRASAVQGAKASDGGRRLVSGTVTVALGPDQDGDPTVYSMGTEPFVVSYVDNGSTCWTKEVVPPRGRVGVNSGQIGVYVIKK